MTQHTRGKWNTCQEGKCSCKSIWSDHYPVAKVLTGEWGDEYPSIRLVGDSSLDLKAEAYMEMIAYGTIAEETAIANACIIVAAVNACQKVNPDNPLAVAENITEMYEALTEAIGYLRAGPDTLDRYNQINRMRKVLAKVE